MQTILRENHFEYSDAPATESELLDHMMAKPWGHEYRVYCDALYDVWKLSLEPGHQTSTHFHARKDTQLLCLRGQGRMRLSGRWIPLRPGDDVFVAAGAQHETHNTGDTTLELLEIEAPRDKLDLVRVHDPYGRRHCAYDPKLMHRPLPPLMPAGPYPAARLRADGCVPGFRLTIDDPAQALLRCGPRMVFAIDLGREPGKPPRLRVRRGWQATHRVHAPQLIVERLQRGEKA